ncbi:MAG: ABC transporter ATP-binding protein [Burkholderiales bacterium RIFOXYD12_FULL_59_19]|nr:MAG: ABC transporter ATP-binding protein [Burkholderiales bacterium RIFOXYD12_FULL_59_19]
MSAIQLIDVSKIWGKTTALENINLQIEEGTFCVLLGPSGCGKSTTLRIIAGLEAGSTGQVWIGGRNVTDLPPAQRGIAMVFQNYALFPHLSVADNITFGLSVRKTPAPEASRRLAQTAELLGLTKLLDRRPSQLSGGQQQRVALGRALVAQAQVCLMDEPLSNLDAQLRQDMRRELRDIQRQLGLTVVYVTHDQTEAMSMADQVVLLNSGQVEQVGTPRDLYLQPGTRFAARFIGTPPMNLLALEEGYIAGSDIAIDTSAAMMGIRPEAIHLHPDGLPAVVQSLEYLGADLVLHCRIGSQSLLARLHGQHQAAVGDQVRLHWAAQDSHGFDARGQRIPLTLHHSPQPKDASHETQDFSTVDHS